MKTIIMITCAVLISIQMIQAQVAGEAPKRLYRTWVTSKADTARVLKGVLYEVRDSSILLSTSINKGDYFNNEKYDLYKIEVRNIDVLRVRRNNYAGRGILIGGLSGAAIGIAIGLASTNTAENEIVNAGLYAGGTIMSSIFFGAMGAIVGAAFSPIKKSFHVGGKQEKFDLAQEELVKRSLTFNPEMGYQQIVAFSKLRDTVVDHDGNVYHILALGPMVFMAENLRVTHFRNGKAIQQVKDSSVWKKTTGAAFRNYLDDSARAISFGRLYNGTALSDTMGICPAGWHIPTFGDWTSLILCMGGMNNAGGYLKQTGTSTWVKPNLTLLSDNAFALPSGSCDNNGVFSIPGRTCTWWVANEKEEDKFQGILLSNENTRIALTAPDRNSGLSIRCMRD